MEYHSSMKKDAIMPFTTTWMDLEMIILGEASQTEKELLHGITYMWTLNNNTEELVYRSNIVKNARKIFVKKEPISIILLMFQLHSLDGGPCLIHVLTL